MKKEPGPAFVYARVYTLYKPVSLIYSETTSEQDLS